MGSAGSLGAILGPFTSGFFLAFDIRWLIVTSAALWAIVFLLMLFAWTDMFVEKQEMDEGIRNIQEKNKLLKSGHSSGQNGSSNV